MKKLALVVSISFLLGALGACKYDFEQDSDSQNATKTAQTTLEADAPSQSDTILLGSKNAQLEAQIQEQNRWILYLVNVDENIISPSETSEIELSIEEGRFSIQACNTIFGEFQIQNSRILFSNIASTRKACSESEEQIEEILMRAIEGKVQFTLQDDELIIENQGIKLVFEPSYMHSDEPKFDEQNPLESPQDLAPEVLDAG